MPDRDPKKSSDMLSGDEPLQATARKMESRNRNRTIHYEGAVNMWQGANRIRADVVDIDRVADKRTLVRTQVVLDDGKVVPVDYAFRKTKEGEWKAYDVIIEGISYVTNYRNQVAQEISKSSLDALTTRLETQGAKALEKMEQEKQQ
jgi:phospholipid transport system substrate-binding protein